MTDLPKVYNPMTGIEIIILSVILAYIATILFKILYMLIYTLIVFHKENYRIMSGFRKQLDNGELTVEEYNRKIREITERFRKGKKG